MSTDDLVSSVNPIYAYKLINYKQIKDLYMQTHLEIP